MGKDNGEVQALRVEQEMPEEGKLASGNAPNLLQNLQRMVQTAVSQHLDPVITILNILQFVGGSLVVYLDIPNFEETLIFDFEGNDIE